MEEDVVKEAFGLGLQVSTAFNETRGWRFTGSKAWQDVICSARNFTAEMCAYEGCS